MKISYAKAQKEIKKFYSVIYPNELQSYEPTLSDVIKVYKDIADPNPGEKAYVLADVFNYLAQDPIIIEHKEGKIYMRTELYVDEYEGKKSMSAFIHAIYIREKDKLALNVSFDPEQDAYIDFERKLKSFVPIIKSIANEDLKIIEQYNKLKEKVKNGEYVDTSDILDLYESDSDHIISEKKYEALANNS